MGSPDALLPRHRIESDLALDHLSEESDFLITSFRDGGPGDWSNLPHRHEFIEFVWVTEGSGTHVIDTQEHPARPGCCFVVQPGQVHFWVEQEPIDAILVLIREGYAMNVGSGASGSALLGPGGEFALQAADQVELEHLLTLLETEQRLSRPRRSETISHYLQCLHAFVERRTRPFASSGHSLAERFTRFARSELDANLTVARCARELAVSPSYLSEVVTAAYGAPPGRMLRRYLCGEAQRLLAHTDWSSGRIATSLGFQDPSYFSRFFRRETSLSPVQFRDRVRSRE